MVPIVYHMQGQGSTSRRGFVIATRPASAFQNSSGRIANKDKYFRDYFPSQADYIPLLDVPALSVPEEDNVPLQCFATKGGLTGCLLNLLLEITRRNGGVP